MGDVVNLNKFRKRKAKAAHEKLAETNKRLHGRTKTERERELKQQQLLDSKLDGARLSKDESKSEAEDESKSKAEDEDESEP